MPGAAATSGNDPISVAIDRKTNIVGCFSALIHTQESCAGRSQRLPVLAATRKFLLGSKTNAAFVIFETP